MDDSAKKLQELNAVYMQTKAVMIACMHMGNKIQYEAKVVDDAMQQ